MHGLVQGLVDGDLLRVVLSKQATDVQMAIVTLIHIKRQLFIYEHS